jgi:hypothetical protein
MVVRTYPSDRSRILRRVLEGLEVDRHRNLVGRRSSPWVRRTVMTIVAAICLAGLLNVFGQRATKSDARGGGVRMQVIAPPALKTGDVFQLRLRVTAPAGIKSPKVVLWPGLLDGLTINTITPDASTQLSRNGATALSYDKLDPGDTLDIFIQVQVNSTAHGRHKWRVDIDDNTDHLLTWTKTVPIFP